jgi:hypothetical protein
VSDWPTLDDRAYHGPLGTFALDAAPHTEADPVAILMSSLVVCGTIINNGPHVLAGNARHPCCLFVNIVGDTAKARKGTALAPCLALGQVLDDTFADKRVMGGFGSAEKLIDELAPAEQGSSDTRLLVVETEFGRILRVAARDGSTMSQTIRDAWDGRPLAARARHKTSVAKDHHVGLIGHITAEELRLLMTEADIYGGLANRLLWGAAHKTQNLPRGGSVPSKVIAKAAGDLAEPIIAARLLGEVSRTAAAEERWAALYDLMADDDPGGLLGAVICRDAPQVLRLSLTYALLDGAAVIDADHVSAAWALWQYCRDSAEMLFADLSGDRMVDRLLAAIRDAGIDGLDSAGQYDALGGHVRADRLEEVRRQLEERGLIVVERLPSGHRGGRPRVICFANLENQPKKPAPRAG